MSNEFVTLGNYSTLESQFVKSILEGEGIVSYVLGDGALNNNIGLGSVGGVEIRVPEDDLERAKQILEEATDSE